jgi:P-type conjugative transfer protein VirB9
MKMKSPQLAMLGLFFAALSAVASPLPKNVDTAALPIAAPKENRIVKYTYSPEVIFRILTLPSLHTHIELGEDEGLKENPMVGDSIQWRVSGGPRNIYVKPIREGIETSLTIVTNKRTYQIQLISGDKQTSSVYQKVSFDYPEKEAEIKLRSDTEAADLKTEETRLKKQVLAPAIDPASLNFNYEIVGEAPFKPQSVYTNGVFTYIRLPSIQDMPAVFLLDEANQPSLINYKTSDNMIIVERVASKLLLKIGTSEIRIQKRETKSNGFW